jgi:D-alanyl-D-alanine carboxypeptidase (penicillin-binding protein 5/6)
MTLAKRYTLSIFVLIFAICALPSQLHAQFETEAEYALLMDAETETILFEKNADVLMSPASMSKLMTLAVVFEALEAGKLTMQSTFSVSENAWRTGGAPSGTAAMFAPLNTDITIEDLVQGVVIQSGNDACIILAEGMSGSEEAFAQRMTDYARRIGLEKSTFGNSSGLPHPRQLMSARELARLSLHIIREYPQYYPYFAQREFPYRKHRFYNRNPLVAANIGADGLKTGHTEESGYGLTGSAVRDGRRLVVVVNGLKTSAARKNEATKLLDWGFRNFSKFTLFKSEEVVGEAMVWGGEKGYVKLRGDGDLQVLLPKDAKQRQLRGKIVYPGPVIAPVNEGDRVGELRVRTEDGITSSAPLFAAESIGRGGLIQQGFDSAKILAFGWLIYRGGGDDD